MPSTPSCRFPALKVQTQVYPVLLTIEAPGKDTLVFSFDESTWKQCQQKVFTYLLSKACKMHAVPASPIYDSPLDWTAMDKEI
jgi:hypothetical protein